LSIWTCSGASPYPLSLAEKELKRSTDVGFEMWSGVDCGTNKISLEFLETWRGRERVGGRREEEGIEGQRVVILNGRSKLN
jgi:hypothetical protein